MWVCVTDGRNGFDEQSFLLSVDRANRPPVALDDAYQVQQGESLVVAGLPVPATFAIQPPRPLEGERVGVRGAEQLPAALAQSPAQAEVGQKR